MNRIVLLALFSTISLAAFSQNITLNLNHEFNGNTFAYNTNYTTGTGDIVLFTRVQYYLSGFSVIHDGGQVTTPEDSYVLASGNMSSYTFDSVSASTIEGFSFDCGVGYDENHGGVSLWSAPHPLSSQTPTMDWGWPSGYFFIVISGMVDNTGDGTPNKSFELHGIGDALLRNVSFSGLSISGSTIDMYVNIADWIIGQDLATIGIDHSGSPENVLVANNTNDENVFELSPSVGIDLVPLQGNSLYVDCTMAYAPTIFYDINTSEKLTATVHDLNGKLLFKKEGLLDEGSLFIIKELKNGTYIATFSNAQVKETIKFNVIN
jgi:hypothetical protein